MARLLVVSRSMALALRLADTHDVVEAPFDALDDLAPSPDLDAVVLDVGEPALAVRTIDRLRRAGAVTPVLVVSGYQPAWAGLTTVDLPGVVVVPLPITRGALLEGVDRLVADRAEPAGPPPAEPVDPPGSFDWWASPRPRDLPVTRTGPLSVARPMAAARPAAARPAAARPAAAGPAAAGPAAAAVAVADGEAPLRPLRRGWPAGDGDGPPPPIGADELTARRRALLGRPAHTDMSLFRHRLGGRAYTTSLGPGGSSPELVALGLSGILDDAPHHDPPLPTPGPPPAGDPPAVTSLVTALSERAGEVLGVGEAATAVAQRAAAATGAATVAVLVRDGDRWPVAATLGPPPEHWPEPAATEQLLLQVLAAGRPLIAGGHVPPAGTGVPLAGWQHVLAAPVPGVQAVVLVAREQARPFADPDVAALEAMAADAGHLLAAALAARRLARLLAPLID